ncbi:methyl-accepting chemotaxis protein [Halopiger djelfimassiliensis]|uniref:methyl-accepting chemotaxis protein n=1 Tax=Halopiger djelfimassiliensis TaxID=1293047 RepID=UPI000677A418|nr:methyl-accepting chemotaxis protein [Halopiger djelfimassiliensis]
MDARRDGNPDGRSIRGVYDTLRGRYVFKIGAAILVVTGLLLGVGYITFSGVQASVENDAEETLLKSADREASGINEFVQDRNADVVRLSKDETITDGTEDEIRTALRTNLEILPSDVQSIHYYNMETSTIEISTQSEREGQQVVQSDRPWAVRAVSFSGVDGARSFEPYEIGGEKRIGFVSPVEGQRTRAIVITVDLTERGALLTAPVEGGTIEVVSTRNGRVALAEDTGKILGEYAMLEALPRLEEEVTEPRTDVVTASHDGIEDDQAVVATVPIDEKSWVVTVVAPRSTVFGTVDEVTRSLMVLIGISLLGFVAVGAVISRDINGSLEELTEYAEAIESGDLDVTIDQSRSDEFGELSTLFVRIRETLKSQLSDVKRRAQEAEAERERAEQAKAEAETAKATAQQAKAEAEALNTHLESKAAAYRDTIEAAADGDLTRRLETDSQSQAMTEIGEAINQMLTDIEQLVVRIQHVAQEVDDRSSDVTASTEEIEASSGDVAESIEEISAGADTQSRKLETAAEELTELSATIEEVASSSETVAEQSEQAATRGKQGQRAATEAIEEMDRIESKAAATVDEMETLQRDVERIGEIVEVIDDIAEETNLLAINASIEAANAEASGDGFAVVATEVKSLAEETAVATREVEQLVEAVEESTESVADDMFEMQADIEDGRETIDEAAETLESIGDRIDEANAGIQSINEATDEQATSAQEVATMVDDITSVSDRTATEVQNVSAAAEEQTSSIQRIATSTESLSDRAEELQSLVGRFETRAETMGTGKPAAPGDD